MARRVLLRDWTTQPQGSPQLDFSNPLLRGLLFASTSRFEPIRAVGGVYAAPTGTQGTAPVDGAVSGFRGTRFAGNGHYQTVGGTGGVPTLANGTPYTVLAFVLPTANPGVGVFGCCDAAVRHFQLRNDGFIAFNSTGTPFTAAAATSLFNAGAVRTIVGRVTSGGQVTCWVDGYQRGSATLTGTIGGNGSGNQYMFGGRNAAAYFSGLMPLFLQWSRALTDAEIAQISANPWQVFERQRKGMVLVTGPGVAVYRPTADLDVTGWTATGAASVSAAINESSASDAEYATSPNLWTNAKMSIASMTAGTYTQRIRAQRLDGVAQVRVRYLDASDVDVGGTGWQALTDTPTTYSLSFTLTATATRTRIEVQ